MKTQIIPDIHNRYDVAENMMAEENADNIIFLGDYFDDYNDTIQDAQNSANWLKSSMDKPNRIHLLGNHDLAYLDQRFSNVAYSINKNYAIKDTEVDLRKLLHYTWLDDWLVTHAGLSNDFLDYYNTHRAGAKYPMNQSVDNFLETFVADDDLRTTLYSVSSLRGGIDKYSGIVWCDYEEFIDIPDVKQIFGHTKGELRANEKHICLDTRLRHYAIYDHSKKNMIVREFK